jgi:CopG family nickel-responsive transcriptional regulator
MCPPFDDPPGFGDDRAEKLLNQAVDSDAIENFVVSDADLDEVSGDVVALVVFDAEGGDEKLTEIERAFEDVVASTGQVNEGDARLSAVSCRGPALRVRELVGQLRADEAVNRVTVTLLRASEGPN